MRSIFTPRPLEISPMRQFTLFVSTLIVALLTISSLPSIPVLAQESTGSASRSGEDVVYNGETYQKLASPPRGNDDNTFSSSACSQSNGTVYILAVRGTSAENGVGAICEVSADRAWYVWFPNARPSSDEKSIIFGDGSITYQERQIIQAVQERYERYDGFPTNPRVAGEPKNLSVPDPRPQGMSDGEWEDVWKKIYDKYHANIQNQSRITFGSGSASSTTSCDSNHTYGLGWIICPATKWLAAGMDQLYDILISFFTVAPLTNDTDSTLFRMWGLVRNLANILFIIGFLVIIYSQITSYGLSNYGIKRLLPRLIIAAILVNVSYWICAILIDASNILGVYIQRTFRGIVDTVQLEGNLQFGQITWQALAGGALTGAVGAFAIAGATWNLVESAGASIWFLLVTLAGVLVSALVAILVLAARQALITVLVIISPLAFVAYLLPSTEKYFERWRSVFFTLLLLFPIFSLIFGASQLAGLIIIAGALENPDSLNFFNLIILGMAVQIAPIVITPLLIRFSGALLGRVAGIVNDPNKGLIDRTRKFSQQRHDLTKNRRLWRLDKNGNYVSVDPLAAGGRRAAIRELKNSHRQKAWETGAIAAFEQTPEAHEVYRQQSLNEMVKKSGENTAKTEFAHEIAHNNQLRRIDNLQRVTGEEAELADNQNKTTYELYRADPTMANVAIRDLARRADEAYDSNKRETMRLNIINQTQEGRFHERMIADADGQRYAGAVEVDVHGPTRVLNISQEAESKAREARVNAAISTLSRTEAKLSEERAVILGNAAAAGQYANLTADVESRSGALRRYVSRAPIEQVQSLMEELDITSSANGNEIAETLRSELVGALNKRKPFYVSQSILNKIEEGSLDTRYYGPPGKQLMIGEALNAGALGTQTMVQADRDDLKATVEYFRNGGTISESAMNELKRELRTAFTDARYRSQMDKRINELSELWNELGGMGPRP